jgi:hypothetical protein
MLALPPADGKFHAILAAFETKQRGPYARIMVVNPLHKALPKLCIMVQASQHTQRARGGCTCPDHLHARLLCRTLELTHAWLHACYTVG